MNIIEIITRRKLDYYINNIQNKKSKYNEEFKLYIKNLKLITNDLTLARIHIKNDYNIKVSKSSIKAIWEE